MTYDDAIAFWFGRINYEYRSAAPADLKLERMRALLRALGDPHHRVRTVHIAGTKGKGSTAALLGSVLREAGYRVGLFTSPHLERVEERIRIDGEPISGGELAALMERIAAVAPALDGITFFEISTALGFLHFVHRRADVAIVEVGLGGRFDSTNVCRPLVCILTTVGFDHMIQLGNTLAEIAFQKAGIIKRGVPVVSGVTGADAESVIARIAHEVGAPRIEPAEPLPYPVGLRGPHQRDNARLALAAANVLRARGFAIPEAAIRRGFANVNWPARVERVRANPTVILDCAHNVPSVEALVRTLGEFGPRRGRRILVFAVSADKDYAGMLRILAPEFDAFFFTQYGHNPRWVPPLQLAELMPNRDVRLFDRAIEAWRAAWKLATGDDLICVTGSVFLAGELRSAVQFESENTKKPPV